MSGETRREAMENGGWDVWTAKAALEFLARPRGKPFLLVASFLNPHNICEWSRRLGGQKQILDCGEIGEPPPVEQLPPLPANFAPQRNEPDGMTLMRRAYQADWRFPVGNYTPDDWRRHRWGYYRMVELVDKEVGRLLEALRASGQEENTLIVFTSDHGECAGAHGWNQKSVPYDEATRVPFIVSWKGKTRPGVSDKLVNTGIDLLPTVLEAAGVAVPKQMPGRSALPVTLGQPVGGWREDVVSHMSMSQAGEIDGFKPKIRWWMVRTERYKYCLFSNGQRRESLVDMQADPGELNNLASDPAHRQALLDHRERLARYGREQSDKGIAAALADEVKAVPFEAGPAAPVAGAIAPPQATVRPPAKGAVIRVTDRSVLNGLSPYNWVCKPDSLSTTVCGASLAVAFKGTRRVALQVDTDGFPSKVATRCPILAWTVNGGALQTHQLGLGETSVTLAENVADPEIDLYIKGMSPFEDRWSDEIPPNSVKITGFDVDRGGTTAAVALPGNVWLNIGDSIMSGDGAAYSADQGRPKSDLWAASDDARASYGYLLARHYGCREARLAYGGYNWGGGLAKVPALTTLIDQRSALTSRLSGEALSPTPSVVLINLGTNGRPKDEDVIAALEKLRRRAGKDAKIVVMIPVSGAARAEVTRAFGSYKSRARDERACLVDLGKITFATTDKVHPTAAGHQEIFKAALPALDAILGGFAPAPSQSGERSTGP
jgi:hypothetical protein